MEIGNVVKVKGLEGPNMILIEKDRFGNCKCIWYNTYNNLLVEEFYEWFLEKVK